jgi:hypothetical protein
VIPEIYQIAVPNLISIIDRGADKVREIWCRTLHSVLPVIFLDAIVQQGPPRWQLANRPLLTLMIIS